MSKMHCPVRILRPADCHTLRIYGTCEGHCAYYYLEHVAQVKHLVFGSMRRGWLKGKLVVKDSGSFIEWVDTEEQTIRVEVIPSTVEVYKGEE